jgi:hypothetical protein
VHHSTTWLHQEQANGFGLEYMADKPGVRDFSQ